MIKHAAIALTLAISLGQAMAATATYYYEIENRRKPHHGWKFHLLGTIHTVPITYLPEPIQNHIKNHKFRITEKGLYGDGHSKPSMMRESYVWEWLDSQYISYGNQYFSKYLTKAQQEQLKKVIRIAYPELVDGGYMYEGRLLTLDDFNITGLRDLYYSGGCRQGMDSYIEDLSPYGKGLDHICKTTKMKPTVFVKGRYNPTLEQKLDEDATYTPFDHPYIKNYFIGTCENMETAEELSDPIIRDRNLAWLPHILSEKKLFSSDYFKPTFTSCPNWRERKKRYTMPPLVAVGCAHLFGETGLLRLLQKQGYRIKRARVDGVFEPYMEAEGGQPMLTVGQRKVLDQVIRKYRGKLALSKRRCLRTLVLKGDTMTPYDRMAIDPIITKMKYGRNKQALMKALRGVADAYPVVKKKTVRKKTIALTIN